MTFKVNADFCKKDESKIRVQLPDKSSLAKGGPPLPGADQVWENGVRSRIRTGKLPRRLAASFTAWSAKPGEVGLALLEK